MTALAPLRDRIVVQADPVLPDGQQGVRWRRLRDGELDRLHAFFLAVDAVDRPAAPTSRGTLAGLIETPGLDLATDSVVAETASGFAAVGIVALQPDRADWVPVRLWGGVHPSHRGRGLGRALLAWMVERADQRLAALGDEAVARISVGDESGLRPAERLFERAGFAPVRVFLALRRDLAVPIAAAPLAPELRATAFSADLDEPLRLAKNAAFAEHWRSQPESAQSWARHHLGPHLARELSRVVLAPDGGIAGFVVTWFDPDRHEPPREAYVELVGVLPEFRGRGIGRAMLAEVLAACARAGLRSVALDVDSENPSGAGRLYASVGFETVSSTTIWSIER